MWGGEGGSTHQWQALRPGAQRALPAGTWVQGWGDQTLPSPPSPQPLAIFCLLLFALAACQVTGLTAPSPQSLGSPREEGGDG